MIIPNTNYMIMMTHETYLYHHGKHSCTYNRESKLTHKSSSPHSFNAVYTSYINISSVQQLFLRGRGGGSSMIPGYDASSALGAATSIESVGMSVGNARNPEIGTDFFLREMTVLLLSLCGEVRGNYSVFSI